MPKFLSHHNLNRVQLEDSSHCTMKQIILAVTLIGFASCGRLENVYLPPNQAQSQSGEYQAGSYSGGNNGATYSGASRTGNYFGGNQAANDVPILRLDNNNDGDTYNFALETGNGISAQEQGDARGEGTRAQGGFSYTAPDGQQIQIQYTADENGFQPQGSHLPTAPPVPEEILKAIEQNLADEARGIFDDGQYREEVSPSQKYANANGQYNEGNGVAVNRRYNEATNNQYVPPAAPQRYQGGYKY